MNGIASVTTLDMASVPNPPALATRLIAHRSSLIACLPGIVDTLSSCFYSLLALHFAECQLTRPHEHTI